MPLHDATSGSKFQAFISTYVLESLSYSFLATNEIHLWTHSDVVPKDFPIQLNTSSIGQFLPGLIQKYGENKPIDIEYRLDKVGNFSVHQDDETFSFDGSVSVNFWVITEPGQKEKALDLSLNSNHFNATVLIPTDSLNVTVNVKQVALGGITLNYTSVGEIDLTLLADLLNDGINIGLPYLNTYLQTLKIIIPQKLFGLFVLSNLTLKYHDSYIEAGLTPTFLPPKSDIPGIYEQFAPLSLDDLDSVEDFTTFMIQEIDENDNVTYSYADDFTYYNYAKSVMSSMWSNDEEIDLFLI